MKRKLAGWASAAITLVAFASPCAATQQIIGPTTSFTARLIGGVNVLVGAPGGTEGTPWLSNFLDMKEGTSDRTVLEYDLRGLAATPKATLYLELTNLDVPSSTPIYMYSFKGNGLANAADYFRTDSYVTTFTDNGLASNFIPPYHIPFSFDLTTAFNQAVAAGDDYLGILLRNSVVGPQYARYRLTTFSGLPKLAIGVPEPSAVCLISTVAAFLIANGRRRQARGNLARLAV